MKDLDLNDIIQIELDKISRKTGHSANCEVSIVSDQSLSITKDGELIDIMLLVGDPPKLLVTMIFIGRCFLLTKTNVSLFRDRLERAIERLPMMRRTLLNNIKPDTALILRRDYTRWLRTRMEVEHDLDESYFECSYSITVKEKLSGISLTIPLQNKRDLSIAEGDAKRRISRIIQASEEIASFRHVLSEMKKDVDASKKLDVIPGALERIQIISGDKDQVKEVREYGKREDNEE